MRLAARRNGIYNADPLLFSGEGLAMVSSRTLFAVAVALLAGATLCHRGRARRGGSLLRGARGGDPRLRRVDSGPARGALRRGDEGVGEVPDAGGPLPPSGVCRAGRAARCRGGGAPRNPQDLARRRLRAIRHRGAALPGRPLAEHRSRRGRRLAPLRRGSPLGRRAAGACFSLAGCARRGEDACPQRAGRGARPRSRRIPGRLRLLLGGRATRRRRRS